MTVALTILDISLFAGSVFEVWARVCWKSGTCRKCCGEARLAPGLSQLESKYAILGFKQSKSGGIVAASTK